MPKKNIKKIFVGLALIVVALLTALMAFYYLEVKPEMDRRAKQEAQAPSAQAGVLANTQAPVPQQETPISKSLENKTLNAYPDSEKSRREGFLWVDKKASRLVATLGAVQGVLPGARLSVYENDQKIGEVVVENSFDVISYVKPVDQAPNSFPKDYYRVVKE
ncbi:MAG: hypothetical protein HQL24_06935 [Candidatus Omnitrophica bacterium]|nr:hypothetical protein [Candidatus Omnitrophota bacterium]